MSRKKKLPPGYAKGQYRKGIQSIRERAADKAKEGFYKRRQDLEERNELIKTHQEMIDAKVIPAEGVKMPTLIPDMQELSSLADMSSEEFDSQLEAMTANIERYATFPALNQEMQTSINQQISGNQKTQPL